jgi:hypothetical protein
MCNWLWAILSLSLSPETGTSSRFPDGGKIGSGRRPALFFRLIPLDGDLPGSDFPQRHDNILVFR